MSQKGVEGLTPDQGAQHWLVVKTTTVRRTGLSPCFVTSSWYQTTSRKPGKAKSLATLMIFECFFFPFTKTDMKSVVLWSEKSFHSLPYNPHFRNFRLSLSASGSGLSLQSAESSLSDTATGEAAFCSKASLSALASSSHADVMFLLVSKLQLSGFGLGSWTGRADFDGGLGPEVGFTAITLILVIGSILAFTRGLNCWFSVSLSSLDEAKLAQTLFLIFPMFLRFRLGSEQCFCGVASEGETIFLTNLYFWGGFWLPPCLLVVLLEGCSAGPFPCFALGVSESCLFDVYWFLSESGSILLRFTGTPSCVSTFGQEEWVTEDNL